MNIAAEVRPAVGQEHRRSDYMHARYRSPLTSRFLSTDPVLAIKRSMKKPQMWNRYSYVAGNPLKYVDPTGELPRPELLSALAAEWLIRTGDFLQGFVAGVQKESGAAAAGVPKATPAAGSPEFKAGGKVANVASNTDVVVEVSGTADVGMGLTGGIAAVNGNDIYAFGGVAQSQSLLPLSASISIGVVQNYGGVGSYGGPFVSSSYGPVGLAFAGNPFGPTDGPVSASVVFSSDIGTSQSATYYLPITALLEEP